MSQEAWSAPTRRPARRAPALILADMRRRAGRYAAAVALEADQGWPARVFYAANLRKLMAYHKG